MYVHLKRKRRQVQKHSQCREMFVTSLLINNSDESKCIPSLPPERKFSVPTDQWRGSFEKLDVDLIARHICKAPTLGEHETGQKSCRRERKRLHETEDVISKNNGNERFARASCIFIHFFFVLVLRVPTTCNGQIRGYVDNQST